MIKVQQESAANTYKRQSGVSDDQREQVKSQIKELREVAQMFQVELAKV